SRKPGATCGRYIAGLSDLPLFAPGDATSPGPPAGCFISTPLGSDDLDAIHFGTTRTISGSRELDHDLPVGVGGRWKLLDGHLVHRAGERKDIEVGQCPLAVDGDVQPTLAHHPARRV